jgi:diguanylate cyclase (GGDEF)-like protein
MSILPILILIYIVSEYILPRFGLRSHITSLITVGILISVGGFFIVKQIIDRIVKISYNVKHIAEGQPVRKLEIETEDEIGELSQALNELSERLSGDMDKIRSYSQMSAQINSDIRRHAVNLSGLLQISSMISQRAKLEEIFNVAVSSCRLVSDADTSYLFLRREGTTLLTAEAADGANIEQILKVNIDEKQGMFDSLLKNSEPMIWDARRPLLKDMIVFFNEKFKLNSTLALPVQLRGKIMGILGIGSCKQVLYNKDEVEILKLFAKQIAIAVENSRLLSRLDKLEVNDALTGVYNSSYIKTRLQEEIQRAIMYQRPCSLTIFDIDGFEEYRKRFGSIACEKALKKVALLIKTAVSEVDRVGRLSDTEFAVILPETNKGKARKMSRDIHKKVEDAFADISDPALKLTISGGISENPIDGVNMDELIKVAEDLLAQAKTEGGNRVKG